MVNEGGGAFLPEDVRERILNAVTPTEADMKRITEATSDLLSRISRTAVEMGIEGLEPVMAGSVAKGTISGSPDLDVFMIFPKGTKKKELEEKGIRIGEMVLDEHEKRYTQHPYITGRFSGMDADIVPCLRIERGDPVSTAVDRTPHHTEYVTSRMSENQREDAVLLKSFLKGIGSYGAEDTVNGFSGYLCELLILYFNDLHSVVKWFAGMDIDRIPPERMELTGGKAFMSGPVGPLMFDRKDILCEEPGNREDHLKRFEGSPLIIIDPVDPGRNVGSPLSDQTLAHTVSMCGKLLSRPDHRFFSPFSRRPHSGKGEASGVPNFPGGATFSIGLPPDNPDMVITQARSFVNRALKSMRKMGDWTVHAEMVLLFPPEWKIDGAYLKARYVWETDSISSPEIIIRFLSDPPALEQEYRHEGPPVDNARADDFRRKWGSKVLIDHERDRLFVYVKRDLTEPGPIFMDIWNNIKIGSSFRGLVPHRWKTN